MQGASDRMRKEVVLVAPDGAHILFYPMLIGLPLIKHTPHFAAPNHTHHALLTLITPFATFPTSITPSHTLPHTSCFSHLWEAAEGLELEVPRPHALVDAQLGEVVEEQRLCAVCIIQSSGVCVW